MRRTKYQTKLLSLFCVLLLIVFGCKKDDSGPDISNIPDIPDIPADTTIEVGISSTDLPADSALFPVYENDIVSNNSISVLDLSYAIDAASGALEFSVDPPLVINTINKKVKFEWGYTIDADENEDGNLLEPQNIEIDFELTVHSENGDSAMRSYTIVVQDRVPDWEIVTDYDNIVNISTSNIPYPIELGDETHHFAGIFEDQTDGVNIGGVSTTKTIRTGQTYNELLAEFNTSDGASQGLETGQYLSDEFSHLWFYNTSISPNILYWINGETWMYLDDFERALTVIRTELEETGHNFINWESGIFNHALLIYGNSLDDAMPWWGEPQILLKLFAQQAADAALLTY